MARDRRWAQGNLQHLDIVLARCLTGMGRLHLTMGAAAYIASALWACSLLALESRLMVPRYFPNTKTLFPIWPISDPDAAVRLLIGTLVLVFLPEIFAIAIAVARARGGDYASSPTRRSSLRPRSSWLPS